MKVSSGILFLALLGGCSSNSVKPPAQAEVKAPTPVIASTNRIKKQVTNNVASRKNPVVAKKAVKKKSNRISINSQKIAQQKAIQQRASQQWAAQQLVKQKKAAQQKASQQWAAKQRIAQQKASQQRAAKQYQKNRYVAQRKVVRKVPRKYYAPPPRRKIARRAPQSVYVSPKAAIRQYRPQQPHVQRVQHTRTQQPYIRKASSLTGDFTGNPKAHRFIDKMVARHGFDRGYLNGVLSNAQATNWMRKMAAKDERPRVRKKKKRSRGPSWTRYRSHFITSRHINAGVAFYHKNRHSLERAERQFGVPKEYIMGILGVETIFGGNVGKNRAIDALTTMAFNNTRRGRYFTSELESYLLMTRSARLNPLTPKASYAGALGLSQFMPSNIKKYGVDFDGDGGINLWKPDDAIASIAKYFKGHGWRTGEMVAVPARSKGKRYRSLKTGFKYSYSPSRLSKKGISTDYQHNMRGSLRFIKLNARGGDELWIGGKNFYVITRYNHSTHYAMAVHQLAQAIKQRIEPRSGSRRIISPKIAPTKKRSISVEEAMELLSASNDRKDAISELRELIAKESIS
ncbi:MAG: lytic murein transglycosylase B [Cocleimonas sp.]|nr:lytic murein transglycosylase B [Cocleimonas sp.]